MRVSKKVLDGSSKKISITDPVPQNKWVPVFSYRLPYFPFKEDSSLNPAYTPFEKFFRISSSGDINMGTKKDGKTQSYWK